MPEAILQTKLNTPPLRPSLVERTQLIDKLNAGLSAEGGMEPSQLFNRKLTLISAPAGYGKTSTVLEWLESFPVLVGWISLDERDNDVNQFTQYLLAACENAGRELIKLRNQVKDTTSTLSLEHILTALINIFADLSKPYFLALDDYHLIHNPAIHDAMTFLIEKKPADLHIIIMSRSELPIPIGRWRAQNEVTELRAADLRLSQDEIAAFFATQDISSLAEEDIQALEERTEGWIAALQLAAIAMKGKEDTSHFISDFTGSHIYVVDYLTDEVMKQQPESIQRFLMQTSLLPRLSADLCDNVLEIEDSQTILQKLEAQNLFLIGLDDRREWYRYHHLFQDMLHYRLQRETPGQIAPMNRRASRWFIQHGWLDDGISQAILVDDWQVVTQIVNQNARGMFSQGKMSTMRRWFSQVPDDIILGNAELCINYAMALNLSGGSDEMEPYLRQAERLLGQTSQTDPLMGQVSLLRGYQSRRSNDFSQSIRYLETALVLLSTDDHVLQATSHIHLGIAYQLLAELSRSLHHLEEGISLARHLNQYGFMAALGLQAAVYVAMGQVEKAEQICRSSMNTEDSNPGFGYVMMALGAILLETDRLDEAKTILKPTVDRSYLSAAYTVGIHSLITLAQLYQQQRRLTDGSICLQQAQRLMQETQAHFGTYHYDQTLVRQWVREKNIPAIQQWLAKHPAGGLTIDYLLIHAEGLIATEQFRQAIRIVESLKLPSEHIEFQIQAQNLLAVAYKEVRDDERCQQAITLALALAEPAGFQRIFCIFNRTMLQILKDALVSHTEASEFSVEYLSKLIRLLLGSMIVEQALDDPLTDREITVLRLMAAGLTNRAIAEELVISIGTVKGYSHNIYTKLAVSKRQDAVQRASDLNLI